MRVPKKNQQQIVPKYYSKMAWQVVILTFFHEKKKYHQKYLIETNQQSKTLSNGQIFIFHSSCVQYRPTWFECYTISGPIYVYAIIWMSLLFIGSPFWIWTFSFGHMLLQIYMQHCEKRFLNLYCIQIYICKYFYPVLYLLMNTSETKKLLVYYR